MQFLEDLPRSNTTKEKYISYRRIYTAGSGYVTASLAPNRPMRHAIILGIIGVMVTILGSMANWDRSHAWYPITLILITLPCAWLGGKLAIRRNKR